MARGSRFAKDHSEAAGRLIQMHRDDNDAAETDSLLYSDQMLAAEDGMGHAGDSI